MEGVEVMKIAYLALGEEYGSPHAGFVHTYNIVKSLSEITNVKLFITGNSDNNDIPVSFVSLPSMKNKNIIRGIKDFKKIKNEIRDFDIIHERFHINPIDLSFIGNKKYVLEVNDPALVIHSGAKGRIFSKLIRMKFKKADAIITQTETLKKILSKFYNGKIFVIPNGVDTNFFEKNNNSFDVRKRYSVDKNIPIITFMGAFREWHGVQDIPEISKKINTELEPVFILVGSGPLFNEVKKKKTSNMIFESRLNHFEIPAVLSQSDILIAPFNTNRFKSLETYGFYWCPVKLFEYMAAGKPIVSYNFSEIKKIVGESSLLSEPDNIDGFVDNLNTLIENPKLRKRMGEYGKKFANENYDWQKRAKDTLKVYEEIS